MYLCFKISKNNIIFVLPIINAYINRFIMDFNPNFFAILIKLESSMFHITIKKKKKKLNFICNGLKIKLEIDKKGILETEFIT